MTSTLLVTILVLVIIGLIMGILSGLLGIGGGVIMIPLLKLGLGCEALVTTGTSLFTIIFTSFSGVIGHLRNKTCSVKIGLLVGVGGMCFSPVGSWLSGVLGGVVVMLIASVLIIYSAYGMLRKVFGKKKAEAHTEVPEVRFTPKTVIVALLIGAIAGLMAGLVGVGGGFIVVPLLSIFFRFPMRQAAGTSLLAVLMFAIPGAATHAFMGHVDYLYGIALACGSIPGALIGARLVNKVPERALRFIFGLLLIVIGVILALQTLGLF